MKRTFMIYEYNEGWAVRDRPLFTIDLEDHEEAEKFCQELVRTARRRGQMKLGHRFEYKVINHFNSEQDFFDLAKKVEEKISSQFNRDWGILEASRIYL